MINLTIENNHIHLVGGGCQAEWCGKWKCIHAHVFIYPASLCLLVGAFNPFTFKVIINMYDLITIFLIVLGLFSVGLFLLLCFLSREVPLAFVVKLFWWFWILFTFACLKSFWFLHQIYLSLVPHNCSLIFYVFIFSSVSSGDIF